MPSPTNQPPETDERGVLGCSAFFFIPVSAFILNLLWKAPKQNDHITQILLVLLESVAITSLLFFSAGLLWSVFGFDVLKKVLDFIAIKFAWTIIPFVLLVITLTIIAVING